MSAGGCSRRAPLRSRRVYIVRQLTVTTESARRLKPGGGSFIAHKSHRPPTEVAETLAGGGLHAMCGRLEGRLIVGTFETCRQTLRMSVYVGRTEVAGRMSKRRF